MAVPVTLEARLAARRAVRPLRTVVLGCGVVGGGVIDNLPEPLILTPDPHRHSGAHRAS